MGEVEIPTVGAPVHLLGFLLLDKFEWLSSASAIEPLRTANILAGADLYAWSNISVDGRPVTASNGTSVSADHAVGDGIRFHTLLVCAGANAASFDSPETVRWLRSLAQEGVRLGGLSGGAYILARAGLLQGRRATIHWAHAPALAEEYPELDLRHSDFEIDGDRLTCGGGPAALDMMVELIEQDHGGPLARAVEDWRRRAPVRVTSRERFGGAGEKVMRVLAYMEMHLEDPVDIVRLAQVAGSTPRQLQRLFLQQLGVTPMRQYLSMRLERGRSLLQQTTMPLTEVAAVCGFANPNHFSRAYRERFGHPPRDERAPGSRRSSKGAAA